MTSTATNSAPARGEVLLDVQDLAVEFDTEAGRARAVDGVSFSVRAGQTLGIVGESGCGKSVTALSILRLLPQPMGRIVGGRILFRGQDLVAADQETLHKVRTGQIGMIFQEPMTALNPVHRIGKQLSEAIMLHRQVSARTALEQSVELLSRVGIPSPEVRVGEFPHQLSGGMRQRVVIAMALACRPALVIADEPTTALDVTTEAQILRLMRRLQADLGMAILFITHNLGVVAEMADDVVVMYLGRDVESAPVDDIFYAPKHPYTQALLRSIPHIGRKLDGDLYTITGSIPDPLRIPRGCPFHPRCPVVKVGLCDQDRPVPLVQVGPQHAVRCWLYAEEVA